MTDEQKIYEDVRSEINTMATPDQLQVLKASEDIRAVIKAHGPHGYMALALIGAEFAFKETL